MKTLWAALVLCVAGCAVVSCGGSLPPPAEPETDAPKAAAEPADDTWEEEAASGAEESSEPASGEENAEPLGNEASDSAVGTEEENAKPLGATVEETRTMEVIRGVVSQHRQKVRACFDALPKADQGSGGTLTVAFKIGPQGNVQEASLNNERSTLKQPDLVKCALDVVKKIEFPKSSRGFESNVNYPFDFKS